jgi:primosomal protein N' (replication factor Y)
MESPPLARVALLGGRGTPAVFRVPDGLAGRTRPGSRVVAPVGAERMAGIVLGEAGGESSHFGAPRAVLEAPDAQPLLPPELLELAAWASAYYLCPLGEMLAAMLPGGLSLTRDRTLRLTSSGEEVARSLLLPEAGGRVASARLRRTYGARAVILRALLDAGEGGLPRRRLAARAGPGASALIETLRKEGILDEQEGPGSLPASFALEESVATPVPVPSPSSTEPARILTPAQERAVLAITAALPGAAGGSGHAEVERARPFLLYGVTGSGKTEVYFRVIDACLAAGRGAIYLVPEIGLTPLLARRMRERYGSGVAVLHSRLSPVQRRREWARLREGGARIALGPRSAVFAPVAQPGCVIVDEEHDPSYKQQDPPRYNARDLALVRARIAGAAVVLGSATPSLESWRNAGEGKYRRLDLPERVEGRALPRVSLVDMREEFRETGAVSPLSRRLIDALRERLERREQAIVLINRRGWAPALRCRACGKAVECAKCSVALVMHRAEGRLRCHYCGARRPPPRACPACASPWLQPIGEGTEQVEAELARLLPGARIARMDSDSVRGRDGTETLLAAFERGEADLLLGTQMVAKGHDFPRVTLAGVLLADAALGLPDFRAGERTFQLLSQVTGRSGRGESPGEVIVQAFQPVGRILQAVARHDADSFYASEMDFRRSLGHPPFTSLALVLAQDPNRDRAAEAAEAAARLLRESARQSAGLEVIGPAPAPLERLRRRWRVQVLARSASRRRLGQALGYLVEKLDGLEGGGHARRISVDVDPANLL